MAHYVLGIIFCSMVICFPIPRFRAVGNTSTGRTTAYVQKSTTVSTSDAAAGTINLEAEILFKRNETFDEVQELPPGVIGLPPTPEAEKKEMPRKVLVLSKVKVSGTPGNSFQLQLPSSVTRRQEGNTRHERSLASSIEVGSRQMSVSIDSSGSSNLIFVVPLGAKKEFSKGALYLVEFQSNVIY